MTALNDFPITKLFPPSIPDVIQLYSFATPNGIKISAALEESGLPYEAHLIDILKDDQKTPEFLALNPNGKIPAMIDPAGPGGDAIGLFESGAILVYLAEKSGNLMPADPQGRYECLQWVFFQMAGVGPMFGQYGHFFKFMAGKLKDDYPTERYAKESRRLLEVLEGRLEGRQWIVGDDYSIADIAIFPWVRTLGGFYEAGEALKLDELVNVGAWLDRCLARPASEKALNIPPRP